MLLVALFIIILISLGSALFFYSNSINLEKDKQLLKTELDSANHDNQSLKNQLDSSKKLQETYSQAIQDYVFAVSYEEDAVSNVGLLIGKIQDSKFQEAFAIIPQIRNVFYESKIKTDKAIKVLPNNQSFESDLNIFNDSRNKLIDGLEKIVNTGNNPNYNSNKLSKQNIDEFKKELESINADFKKAKSNIDKIQNRESLNVLQLKNYYDTMAIYIGQAITKIENTTADTNTMAITTMTQNLQQQPTLPQTLQLGDALAVSTCEGKDDAPVAMVVATDQQCPFCARLANDTLVSLEANEVQEGKVKLCQFAFPLSFHPFAQKGAEADYCAKDQGKYWEMSRLIFENQDKMTDSSNQTEFYKGLAGQISGIDTAIFENCLSSGKYSKQVQDEYQLGVKLGVNGTPTIFIGLNNGANSIGTTIVGAQPLSVFQSEISNLLNGTAK